VATHWKYISSNKTVATTEELKEILVDDTILVELYHNLKYRTSLKRRSAPLASERDVHYELHDKVELTSCIPAKRNGESVPNGKYRKVQSETDCEDSTEYMYIAAASNNHVTSSKEGNSENVESRTTPTEPQESITLHDVDDKVSTSSDVLFQNVTNKGRDHCRSVWATIEREYGSPRKDVLLSHSPSSTVPSESVPDSPTCFNFPSQPYYSPFSCYLRDNVKPSNENVTSTTWNTDQVHSPALSTDSKTSCSTCHSTITLAYKDRLPGADSTYVTSKGTYSDCAKSYVGSDIKLDMRPVVLLDYMD
jgi:hypothetical protein